MKRGTTLPGTRPGGPRPSAKCRATREECLHKVRRSPEKPSLHVFTPLSRAAAFLLARCCMHSFALARVALEVCGH